jgi:YesN/AraC family two-component response regulator
MKNTEEYFNQENEMHRTPDEEIQFFHAVCNGDIDTIYQNCAEHRFLDSEGVGQLSRDPVQNLRYHMVVTAALITRNCIQKGLEQEKAFRMSDFYIRKLDDTKTIEDVEKIHDALVLDFTGKMRLLRNKGLSKTINKCLNYIYAHIYERITIQELADNSHVSKSYLSRQFVKEVGVPISDYIRESKIEIAQEKLRTTEDSILDISCMLSFASQSHFIDVFKNITGMTPKKYRDLNKGSRWSIS